MQVENIDNDESDDNIIQENNVNDEGNNNQQEGVQTVQVEEKKKKKIARHTFKVDHLLDPDRGLKFLYEQFKTQKFYLNDNLDEVAMLSKFMTFIENWHFYCFPKYEFNYFINRCEAFGQKPAIKAHLNRMREIHQGKFTWQELEYEMKPAEPQTVGLVQGLIQQQQAQSQQQNAQNEQNQSQDIIGSSQFSNQNQILNPFQKKSSNAFFNPLEKKKTQPIQSSQLQSLRNPLENKIKTQITTENQQNIPQQNQSQQNSKQENQFPPQQEFLEMDEDLKQVINQKDEFTDLNQLYGGFPVSDDDDILNIDFNHKIKKINPKN